MRRIVLLALFLAVCSTAAHAQFGRLKNAVSNAVQSRQDQAPAQQNVVVPFTPDVVNRYLTALAARQEAMRNLARENSSTGRYFAAVIVRDSLIRRHNLFNADSGPDYDRYRQLMAAYQRGDTTAGHAMTDLAHEIDPTRIQIPESDWSAQRAGNARLDSTMKRAGGFSDAEWGYVNDLMPRVVAMMAYNAARDDSMVTAIAQNTSITEDEVRAVRARRVELSQALGMSWKSVSGLERAAREASEFQKDFENPYASCIQREMQPIMQEADRRRSELEAAQKNGETQKLMDFANRMSAAQMAASQKCAPLLNQGQ